MTSFLAAGSARTGRSGALRSHGQPFRQGSARRVRLRRSASKSRSEKHGHRCVRASTMSKHSRLLTVCDKPSGFFGHFRTFQSLSSMTRTCTRHRLLSIFISFSLPFASLPSLKTEETQCTKAFLTDVSSARILCGALRRAERSIDVHADSVCARHDRRFVGSTQGAA